METAYKNNVHMHFPKYVAAVARKVLQDAEVAAYGAENWRLVPSAAKKVVSRNVAVLRDAANNTAFLKTVTLRLTTFFAAEGASLQFSAPYAATSASCSTLRATAATYLGKCIWTLFL